MTRPPKDRSRTVDDLSGEWRARALEWGFPPSELTRVVGLGRVVAAETGREPTSDRSRGPACVIGVDPDRLAKALRDLAVTDRSLARRDLVAKVAAACPNGAPAATLEAVADQVAEGSSTGSRADRWRARDLAESVERFEGRTLVPDERTRTVEIAHHTVGLGSERRLQPPARSARAREVDGREPWR